jgi:hypothetical protein
MVEASFDRSEYIYIFIYFFAVRFIFSISPLSHVIESNAGRDRVLFCIYVGSPGFKCCSPDGLCYRFPGFPLALYTAVPEIRL